MLLGWTVQYVLLGRQIQHCRVDRTQLCRANVGFSQQPECGNAPWPDRQEQERSKAGFLAKSDGKGPQNTIGCIDGCHVEINKPTESPNSYYNRKKFPLIVLQGIANDRSKFLDVFIGFPGSAHDARILCESTFR